MSDRISRWAAGFVAAVLEAWQELRIHKLRVLLSLIGVMVAVASLTAAVAAAAIAKQVVLEQYEHEGRPAFLNLWTFAPQSGTPAPPERIRPAVFTTAERFGIDYVTMVGAGGEMLASNDAFERNVEIQVVDPTYAAMHRIVPRNGRWLVSADGQNRSPAVVVNERLLEKLGLDGRPLPLALDLGRSGHATVTVVGTVPRNSIGGTSTVYMLPSTYEHWFAAAQPLLDASFEMWVPVDGWKELSAGVRRSLSAELPGFEVDVSRQDYLSYGGGDPLREVTLVVSAIAGLILLLGVLSLLNVALVTIQQRVREVGIRRSFGATTGRVFFSVMMESVVATVVAGAIGVLLAVAAVTNPWVADRFLDGIDDPPPFPIGAALLGLLVSVGVGVLAGVLPALVAARVKIVDAIRF